MDTELKDLDNTMHEELINVNQNEIEAIKTYGRSCTSGEEDHNDISNGSCNDK